MHLFITPTVRNTFLSSLLQYDEKNTNLSEYIHLFIIFIVINTFIYNIYCDTYIYLNNLSTVINAFYCYKHVSL